MVIVLPDSAAQPWRATAPKSRASTASQAAARPRRRDPRGRAASGDGDDVVPERLLVPRPSPLRQHRNRRERGGATGGRQAVADTTMLDGAPSEGTGTFP